MRWLELPSGMLVNVEALVYAGTLHIDVPDTVREAIPDLELEHPNRVMSVGGAGATLSAEDFKALVGYIRGQSVKLT